MPSVVLDPFGGSGTTGQVAIHAGRHAVICELQEKYLPLIEERMAIKPKLKLLGWAALKESFSRRAERHEDGGAFTCRKPSDE